MVVIVYQYYPIVKVSNGRDPMTIVNVLNKKNIINIQPCLSIFMSRLHIKANMCHIWVISILNPSTQPVEVTLADFLIWLDGHPVNIFTLLPFGLWIIIQIGKTYWRGSTASMESYQRCLVCGEDLYR